ncbi:SMP-30/gluconolactonase/LRE family protein [Nitratireductor mangrovi]|uniref:SMP-30/gluconolactonase/LRE family protein n=1 Tax=Nitratireductor mangrovi TaxID=2599600 RepID=A0A5B8KXW5_9HYPH|nr:SMP-30/gluconolactonase/LRE family protein [Nitratireductor mangrovi]QDZ00320.1 SMP-30/gluconolactonase/LRE family protein [Nitratireductor mangrovi]
MAGNPIDGFTVSKADIRHVGHDLQRPECILAERDGSLWAADARSGVMHIRPDGSQQLIAQSHVNAFETTTDEAKRFTEGTLPNGLAFARDGSIYISNFGTDCLELMTRDGDTRVLIDKVDGRPIGKVNFVLRDSKDRLWVTVSTQIRNWMDAARSLIRDGSILLVDGDSVRTVATDIAFTNEVRLDANEEWLYVVETTARNITRFRVADDGSLFDRQIFGPEDHGAFIDGIAFDEYGNLWGTHVMSDRIFAITPEGELRIILDDENPEPARRLKDAFDRGEATPELMLAAGGTIAPWFASVTFGGPDLKNVYIGSLRGTTIPWFRSPVAGLPMVHWSDPRP